MKKAMTIGMFILIGFIFLSSQAIKTNESEILNQDVIQEDEIVLEDWMTEPFIIDTTKNEEHV